jgi:hypothetical protein
MSRPTNYLARRVGRGTDPDVGGDLFFAVAGLVHQTLSLRKLVVELRDLGTTVDREQKLSEDLTDNKTYRIFVGSSAGHVTTRFILKK